MTRGSDLNHCFLNFPTAPDCFISIVVPVRDEAATIRHLLESFTAQVLPPGFGNTCFEILLLANNCTDDSVAIIKKFQSENPNIPVRLAEVQLDPAQANVGYVRRLLMTEAFLRQRERGGVIMTTDGDTTVAPDWIASNLLEIGRGADAVGGRILIPRIQLDSMHAFARELHLADERYRLLTAEIEALIDELPFDDGPRHHQHFNASFAVTADAYERSGGMPCVEYLEDCAFYERLERADLRVRHSPDVVVYTSARPKGKSKFGLAYQIDEWRRLGTEGKAFFVEDAQSLIERFTTRRDLRRLWNAFQETDEMPSRQALEVSSKAVYVPVVLLIDGLQSRKKFGEFYGDLMIAREQTGAAYHRYPPEPVEKAVRDLMIETAKRRGSRQPLPNVEPVILRSLAANVS